MAKPKCNVRKAAMAARRKGPEIVTCPASRHVHVMADALWHGREYPMFTEEPKHCAESLFAVVKALWEARQQLAAHYALPDPDEDWPDYACPEDPDGQHHIGCGCE